MDKTKKGLINQMTNLSKIDDLKIREEQALLWFDSLTGEKQELVRQFIATCTQAHMKSIEEFITPIISKIGDFTHDVSVLTSLYNQITGRDY